MGPLGEWISLAEARRRLGIGYRALFTLIAQGRLSVRRVPGSKPRVRLDEVDALASECTRPATAPAKEAEPCAAV